MSVGRFEMLTCFFEGYREDALLQEAGLVQKASAWVQQKVFYRSA
jgi:hypothetical protein